MAERSATLIPIRKMNRSRAPLVGIFAALLILAAAVIWATSNGKDGQHVDTSRPLRADFEAVWSWSDSDYAGGAIGAQWSFRWDGTASLITAKSFAARLGFQLNNQLADGSIPIDVVASDPAYKLTLWVHSRPSADEDAAVEPSYDMVLLLDAAKHADRKAITDAISKVERSIVQAGLDLQGGFTVKGTAAEKGAGARIVKAAAAEEAESYDDGHTSSLTYYSKTLGSKVQSNNKAVNLQIAETSSSNGKGPELIIGVPLITGDYTMQDK